MREYVKGRFKTLRLGLYETIAFATGFILMAYELVAARILAPSIGTSMYVWTSVIGTMIAALALGYAAGGWIADKRTAKQDIAWLLLLSCLAVTATLLFYQETVSVIVGLSNDQRVQGVLAALLLFMPASFLLGMISPYLVRLRTRSVETTGRSVAGLSALNSIGGITGTFATGFLFFTWIGSRETLALLAALLLVCSWAIMPRHRLKERLIMSVGLLLAVSLEVFAPARAAALVASIDTPSAHYEVVNARYGGRDVRVLMTGPFGFQSGVYRDGSRDLAFAYAQKMAALVEASPAKDRILILGGGALTIPDYLAHAYPSAQIDVVEIDPRLEAIAKEHFNYSSPSNVRLFATDARAFVERAAGQYDVILVDVYSDSFIPFSLTTTEYAQSLRELTHDHSTVIANIIASVSDECAPLLASMDTAYRGAFKNAVLFPVRTGDLTQRQNLIVVYANSPLTWAAHLDNSRQVFLPAGRELTDNYAPVESMNRRCNATRF